MKIDKINDHLVKVGKKVAMMVATLIEEVIKQIKDVKRPSNCIAGKREHKLREKGKARDL